MDEERYGRPVHIWTIEEILDLPGVEIEECMSESIPFEDYLKQREDEESGEHRI